MEYKDKYSAQNRWQKCRS